MHRGHKLSYAKSTAKLIIITRIARKPDVLPLIALAVAPPEKVVQRRRRSGLWLLEARKQMPMIQKILLEPQSGKGIGEDSRTQIMFDVSVLVKIYACPRSLWLLVHSPKNDV